MSTTTAQPAIGFIGLGDQGLSMATAKQKRWTRPSFLRTMRAVCSSTCKCFEIAGTDIKNG